MSPNPITLVITVVLAGLGVAAILSSLTALGAVLAAWAVLVFAAVRMAQQWERAILLPAGKAPVPL